MALSKDYTLAIFRGIVILWQKELNISRLDPDLVDDFINLAVNDAFEEKADAIMYDYGRTQNLNDSGSAFSENTSIAGSFTHSTKNIEDTGHGLTASDIGKRIIFGDAQTGSGGTKYVTIGTIVSITDADNFVVSHSPGVDIPWLGGPTSVLFYAVLPAHSSLQLDLSALRIFRVRKLVDSVNGEVIPVFDARDFENLANYPQKQNKVYYYEHGEIIQLYQGDNVGSLGTLTLHYYGYPAIPATEDDYLDIKDNHMPLVIQKTQNYILAHLAKQSINAFDPNSSSKSANSRQIEERASQKLEMKK